MVKVDDSAGVCAWIRMSCKLIVAQENLKNKDYRALDGVDPFVVARTVRATVKEKGQSDDRIAFFRAFTSSAEE